MLLADDSESPNELPVKEDLLKRHMSENQDFLALNNRGSSMMDDD